MFVTHKEKTKKSKITKRIWMKPCLITRSNKSNLLTNNSGIILEWMQHHTVGNTLTFIHSSLIYLTFITLTIMTQRQSKIQKEPPQVFSKVLQISQENTCVGVSFTKLQAFSPGKLLERDSYTCVFLWNLRNA